MRLGLLWSRIAALLCAGLFVFAVSGCGGGDDEDSSGSADQQTRTDDQKEAATFVAKFVKTARSGNAEQFCSLMEPGAVKETFGSAGDCAEIFGPLLKQSKIRGQFEISNLEFDGDQATVTFKDGKGQGDLEKVDGQWYVQIPDGLAKQVEAVKG